MASNKVSIAGPAWPVHRSRWHHPGQRHRRRTRRTRIRLGDPPRFLRSWVEKSPTNMEDKNVSKKKGYMMSHESKNGCNDDVLGINGIFSQLIMEFGKIFAIRSGMIYHPKWWFNFGKWWYNGNIMRISDIKIIRFVPLKNGFWSESWDTGDRTEYMSPRWIWVCLKIGLRNYTTALLFL